MFKKFIALFLISIFSLSSSETAFPTLVHNVVDPTSGQYSIVKEDIVIPGPVPLTFKRYYRGTHENEKDDGWSFLPHIYLDEVEREKTRKFSLRLKDETGSTIRFRSLTAKTRDQFVLDTVKSLFLPDLDKPIHPKSITISWNQKNQTYCLSLGNGRERLYGQPRVIEKNEDKESKKDTVKRYRLLKETLSSGHKICYHYDSNGRSIKIWTTNPSEDKEYNSLLITYKSSQEGPSTFNVLTSDGREYEYFYQTHHSSNPEKAHRRLHEITGSDRPTEVIFYQKIIKDAMPKLHTLVEHHNHYIAAEYYTLGKNSVNGAVIEIKSENDPRIGRIRALKVPTGLVGHFKEIYHFYYHLGAGNSWGSGISGRTEVVRADGARMFYTYYSDRRLKSIESYFKNDYIGKKYYVWGQGSEGRILKGIAFFDRDKPLSAITYNYDSKGNLVEETTWGEITGEYRAPLELDSEGLPIDNGVDRRVVKYVHSQDQNVIREEQTGGLTYHYTYLPGTNCVTAKLVAHDGIIKRRKFYIYNEDHELVGKIKDDGRGLDSEDLENVSFRLINEYTREKGNIIALKESYYEPQNQKTLPLRSLHFAYDERKNILKQDLYNADNEWVSSLSYQYDQWDNPVEITNEVGEKCSRIYDSYGCVTKEKWGSGLIKDYGYDFNRTPMLEIYSLSNGAQYKKFFDYDHFGCLKGESDLSGNWTNFEHDGRGNVTAICSPPVEQRNGTVKSNKRVQQYNVLGHLIYTIDELGYLTRYKRNIDGEPLQITDPKGESEFFSYDLRGNKVRYKDREGHLYRYEYDHFNRLTRTLNPDGSEERSAYNAFFRLKSLDIHGNEVHCRYDGAGRLIQEEEEGILREYHYDSLSRLKKMFEWMGDSCCRIATYEYDALNRIISQSEENEEGNLLTRIEYEYGPYNLFCHTKVDGALSTKRFDEMGRLIEEIDPDGRSTLYSYDCHFLNYLNDCVQKTEITTSDGKKREEILDVCGRPAMKTEFTSSGELIARERFFYNAQGALAIKIEERLGEGEKVTKYHSNYRGLPSAVIASDGTTYRYEYDSYGRVKQILKPDGVKLLMSYDFRGRPLTLSSSDGTVDYQYEYATYENPIEIRDLVGGGVTHRHYDAKGNLLSETLPTGVTLSTRYDALNRPIQKILPDSTEINYLYDGYYLKSVIRKALNRSYAHLCLSYDGKGNSLEESMIYGLGSLKRDYDQSGNLISFYSPYAREHHDETGTCFLEIDFKELRRPIAEKEVKKQALKEEGASVICDALDRPIIITTPTKQTRLFYDGLSRLMAKETTALIKGVWQERPRETFIYDDTIEIGKIEKKAITQLRLVKPGTQEAIAYELDQKPFAPIFSLEGELLTLVDPEMRANAYVFAFDKENGWSFYSDLWRFRGERFDTIKLPLSAHTFATPL